MPKIKEKFNFYTCFSVFCRATSHIWGVFCLLVARNSPQFFDFKFKYLKIPLISTVALVFSLSMAVNVQARDDYFKPAIGEALISSVGVERAMLSEDGSLVLIGGDGKMLPLWPLSIDNIILIGSPLLADMNGDGVAEVVTFGRDTNNIFTLFVYDGNKKLVASISFGTEILYYDAVSLPLKNQTVKDILVSTQSGKILQIHLKGSQLISSVLLNVSKPAVITVNSSGTELLVAYPSVKTMDIYTIDGTKITLSKKIILS